MLYTALVLIIIIAVLVLVHEFGHFFCSRKAGVQVDEFGFGFPPKLASYKSQESGTVYSLNWIPLGGFVKLKGEQGEDPGDSLSFANKSIGKRALIIVGGVFMNMVLAVVLLSVGYMIGLPSPIDDTPNSFSKIQAKYATVTDIKTKITHILEKSPAQKADLKPGDYILSLDNKQYTSISSLREYLASKKDQPVIVEIKRDSQTIIKQIKPSVVKNVDGKEITGFGVGLAQGGLVRYPVYMAPVAGVYSTYSYTSQMIGAIGTMFKSIFGVKGSEPLEVTGPVGIAKIISDFSKLGFVYLLYLTAILSINLALINILPIPALDGGRLLFLGIECVIGKKVNAKVEAVIHNMGFVLLMILIVMVTFQDIARLRGGG